MPKIERSVDYTFEAYSGLEDQEDKGKNDSSNIQQGDLNTSHLEEETDDDETSKSNYIGCVSKTLKSVDDVNTSLFREGVIYSNLQNVLHTTFFS